MTAKVNRITVLDHRIERICKKFYNNTKVSVVRSGIDLSAYAHLPKKLEARKELSIPTRPWVWLCLSIFNPHRCFEDVIGAFEQFANQHPQALLYLVGSSSHAPDYVATLRSMVKDKHLDKRVIFVTDYLTVDQKLQYLVAADGFIFPNDQQTWGLVVIEAMATGLPCIISTGAGVHEVVRDSYDGLVYPRRNILKLLTTMDQLYVDADLRIKIIDNAKKHVWNTYSWRAYAEQMEHFCRS
jgi:glycosyltransferase involved in cell wall biosynthesis